VKPIPEMDYHKPESLEEALELHDQHENSTIMAGGTDIIPQLRTGEKFTSCIIDISAVRDLNYIKEDEGFIKIGSATTHSQLINSDLIKKEIPALHESVSEIGSPQIRNMATIGGNLCNASPAADSAPPLLVHNSEIVVASKRGLQIFPLKELFTGPKSNCLKTNEILTEIRCPKPTKAFGSAYRRIGRRKAFTLSLVNASAHIEKESNLPTSVRIAVGAVAPTPIRLFELEKKLIGKPIKKMIQIASEECVKLIEPITDHRASADYRNEMTKVLLKRTLEAGYKRAAM